MSRPVPAPNPAEPSADAAPDSFESALERLEGIVSRMEGERLPLEELLVCYEQGTKLLKSCGDYLAAAEQRIELIVKDENGQPRTVEFSSSTAPVAAAAPSDNRPADAAEPISKSRGPSREGKSSSSPSSRGGGQSAGSTTGSSNQPEAGTGSVTKSPRTNHEVSLF